MLPVTSIIYRYLTPREYFNIYKPTGNELGGGGQRYIDFPTSAISLNKWRSFLEGITGLSESQVKHGPRWQVPVLSIFAARELQSPALATVYQRRPQSLCIANQHISSDRLPAWRPETGFPSPTDHSEPPPSKLAVYLAKTANGELWSGWFDATSLPSVCRSDDARTQLDRMLDRDNEPGSTGIVAISERSLFLNSSNGALPRFLSKNESQISDLRLEVKSIEIAGFKSLKGMRCELGSLNVLVGANGAGKSNFLSLFQLLVASSSGRLDEFVQSSGGAKSLLHLGPSVTEIISIRATLRTDTEQGDLLLAFGYKPPDTLYAMQTHEVVGVGSESILADVLVNALRTSVAVLPLLNTSIAAPIRQECYIEDNKQLREDGGNLAPVLYLHKHKSPSVYNRIRSMIRKIVPGFDDFVLEPKASSSNDIVLNWRQAGSDYVLGPHQISDGSLRSMLLVTLLLQPEEDLPNLLFLDEPEVGLHPHAASMIAGLIRAASHNIQVIVSTQSPTFVDEFSPDEIIVTESKERESTFSRLAPDALTSWLEEYSLGELWQKNVFGGGPA